MKRLPTVSMAMKEIEELQNFVELTHRHPEKDCLIKPSSIMRSLKV